MIRDLEAKLPTCATLLFQKLDLKTIKLIKKKS